ncbi:glycosyltransferase family 2 protein [Olsenella sp. HMSC062G07]|uniref:glycosyltransferase family 2 protein n=1 Tax=Olsenella sp. HMSC062G07 TaxID=1739330 RepID=UPI0008A3CC39|nr:glycosyltransferase family 2 protein [Olsenella sp. HMSC062G07]OFK22478.1 glycosyl transferase [Olsenella sp. HMSC062G07]
MSPTQPKISVIMPAYNVAAYVGRAVESLQHQTFEDFELLAVDDGSQDRTGAILDSFAARDIRITVIHQENAGAPAARNAALDRAAGTYVMFFDADDWAEPTMLATMYEFGVRNRLELVVSGFYIDTYFGSDDRHDSEVKSCEDAVFATQADFRRAAWRLFDNNQLYPPWNKLFLRRRIEDLGLRFRATFWDDFPFVLDFIRDVEWVGVMSQPFYHFIRQRSESETARWRPDMYEKREEEHGWMLDLYRHWGLDGDAASMEMVQRRYIERLVGCIENVCNPLCELSRAQKLAEIRNMISTERARVAVEVARPRSRMMQAMLAPIKARHAGLCYQEGTFISFVKRHNGRLFATLKARR